VILGAPSPSALSVTDNTQLLAAIKALRGGPRRVQVANGVSEGGSQIPVKAWFTGTLYQYAESCIDPSIHHTVADMQELVWWMVGVSNPTANPITVAATICAVDDGANVFWNGASVCSVYGDIYGTPGTATANITIAAGASNLLEVLFYNRGSAGGNAGYLLFTLGDPFPAGLQLYDPGTVFA